MVRRLSESQVTAWRERLGRMAVSGQTVAEFCKQEGTTAATYYYWRRRLSAAEASVTRPRTSRRQEVPAQRRGNGAVAATTSVAVGIDHPFVPVSLPLPRSSMWIELALVDGTLIRVPRDQLAALELILQALGNSASPWPVKETRHA